MTVYQKRSPLGFKGERFGRFKLSPLVHYPAKGHGSHWLFPSNERKFTSEWIFMPLPIKKAHLPSRTRTGLSKTITFGVRESTSPIK